MDPRQPADHALPLDASDADPAAHSSTDSYVLRRNQAAWDRMAAASEPLCTPASDRELADPLAQVDPLGWLGPSIHGWDVLCLAAGGGRHSALYAAAGANVTVVDLSPAMLELDRQVARGRGFSIRIVQANMEQMPALDDASFDLVIQPVSTCYIRSLSPVYAEVARVLRGGGLYVSQHKQPTSLQASTDPAPGGAYTIQHTYYRDAPVPPPTNPSSTSRRLRESGATEYLHRWEQIIGGMCRAGFEIEDLVEPLHARDDAPAGSFGHRARYVAPYVRIKARRRAQQPHRHSNRELWLP